MRITVKNITEQEIKVAINHWAGNSNSHFMDIKSADSKSWDRSDERRFVMVVKKAESRLTYYIQFNYDIVVSNDKVTANNSTIHSIS